MATNSSVPDDHPLTVSGEALAHRLNVARLRMTQGAPLCELKAHLEALVQDTCSTLRLLDVHPDQEAVLLIGDLGPDADFLASHLA